MQITQINFSGINDVFVVDEKMGNHYINYNGDDYREVAGFLIFGLRYEVNLSLAGPLFQNIHMAGSLCWNSRGGRTGPNLPY